MKIPKIYSKYASLSEVLKTFRKQCVIVDMYASPAIRGAHGVGRVIHDDFEMFNKISNCDNVITIDSLSMLEAKEDITVSAMEDDCSWKLSQTIKWRNKYSTKWRK